MRVRIHRGATEIGGSCVELEAEGKRLLLDLGLPLDAQPGEIALPDISGLDGRDSTFLGVVVSHPHPDHYGLLPEVNPSVPFFIGEAAERILQEAAFFSAGPSLPLATDHLAHLASLDVGPFHLTPYLVDHSAFDSYAVLVEAEGRRLFYTGDLRAHGRKPGTFSLLLEDPPKDIDVLLLEGTRIAPDQGRQELNETELEDQLVERCAGTGGALLTLFSPQNIDRLVTVFRAARRSGRELVLDLYGASVAAATERSTIPQPGFDGLRVYVPQRQRVLIKGSRQFDRVESIRPWRIYTEELAADPERYVVLFRHSMGQELLAAGVLAGAAAVWMMWSGYLENDRGLALQKWLAENRIEMTVAHASGHATLTDLRRVAEAVDAGRVVPIHTSAPELYDEHFKNVDVQGNGVWWEV